MYCPSCGLELTSELSYCNRCGANLKPLSNQSGGGHSKLVGTTWAISLAVVLVTLGVNLSGGGMVLIVFSLLIILTVAALLIRQLSRVLDVAQLSGGATQSKQPQQPMLSEKPVQQISPPREPVASVTEHTTRMFEPILKDRDTQR
jgi:hypothetical protein